jgi:quercetin dioxygenase-like cupin family protein
MDTEILITDLQKQGYAPVYVWNAEPNEDDPSHSHEFDTHIRILVGELTITNSDGDFTLEAGSTIDISKGEIHAAKAGPNGCTYIVAEKHYS